MASGFGVGPAQENEHEPIALATGNFQFLLVLSYFFISFNCKLTENEL